MNNVIVHNFTINVAFVFFAFAPQTRHFYSLDDIDWPRFEIVVDVVRQACP